MPQLGVMREILEREEESMRVEADFFSVASTMPLVAGGGGVSVAAEGVGGGGEGRTFYAEGGYALVDGVEGIFWVASAEFIVGSEMGFCGPICPSLPLRAISRSTHEGIL